MPSERAPKWVHPRDIYDEPRGDELGLDPDKNAFIRMWVNGR